MPGETSVPFLVALDFEATCEAARTPSPQEVIEFPSVLYDVAADDVADEFTAFVRPVCHPTLSDFCRDLTGISPADVDDADEFPAVLERHLGWLSSHGLTGGEARFTFVTCGDWDLRKMLPHQVRHTRPPIGWIPPPYRRWVNVKRVFAEHYGAPAAVDLPTMLSTLGGDFVGRHHRGIDDARNIIEIVRRLLRSGHDLEVTGRLNIRQHPPLEVTLHLRDEPPGRRPPIVLRRRSLEAITGVTRATFPDQNVRALTLAGEPLTTALLLDQQTAATVEVVADPVVAEIG